MDVYGDDVGTCSPPTNPAGDACETARTSGPRGLYGEWRVPPDSTRQVHPERAGPKPKKYPFVMIRAAISLEPAHVDVEIRGELTRGMSVVDARWSCPSKPNVELATGVDTNVVRQYMKRILERAT